MQGQRPSCRALQEFEQTLQGLLCEGLEQISCAADDGDEAATLQARPEFTALLDGLVPEPRQAMQ